MAQAQEVIPLQTSLIEEMAKEYGVEPGRFLITLRATVLPKDVSNEDAAVFLITARKYRLNPFLREIYCFPRKGGGLQTIVGVDGWANLINQHPQFDGAKFVEHLDKNNKVVGITCHIFRKDRAQPIAVTEYLNECKRNTDVWAQWPMRMLRHRAFIQCGRYAFGFAGLLDPEEADLSGYKHLRDVTPGRDAGPPLAITETDKFPDAVGSGPSVPTAEEEAAAPPEPTPAAPPSASTPAPTPAANKQNAKTAAPKNSEEYLAFVRSTCDAATDPERLRSWWVSDQQRRARFNAGVTGDESKQGKQMVDQRLQELGP